MKHFTTFVRSISFHFDAQHIAYQCILAYLWVSDPNYTGIDAA